MPATATPKPIVHVTVGDTVRPVRFGFNAVADFCDAAGLSLADLQDLDLQTLNLKSLRALYWAGFKDGARKEGIEFDATPEDIGDWMDEIGDEEGAKILTAFAGAQGAADGQPSGSPGKPAAKKTRAKAR